jgi:hypothetical protein
MDQFERELMNIFNCKPEWPICLFDFTYKNKVPNFFNFRVGKNLNSFIIDNYFEDDGMTIEVNPKLSIINRHSDYFDLLIERNIHLCTHTTGFVPNFKLLFN